MSLKNIFGDASEKAKEIEAKQKDTLAQGFEAGVEVAQPAGIKNGLDFGHVQGGAALKNAEVQTTATVLKQYDLDIEGVAGRNDPMPTAVEFDDSLAWSKHPTDGQKSAMEDYRNGCLEILNAHDSLPEGYEWKYNEETEAFNVYNGKGKVVDGMEVDIFPNDVRRYCENIGSPMTNGEALDLHAAQTNLYTVQVDEMSAATVMINPMYAITKDGMQYAGPGGIQSLGKDPYDMTKHLDFNYTSKSDEELFTSKREANGIEIGYDKEATFPNGERGFGFPDFGNVLNRDKMKDVADEVKPDRTKNAKNFFGLTNDKAAEVGEHQLGEG